MCYRITIFFGKYYYRVESFLAVFKKKVSGSKKKVVKKDDFFLWCFLNYYQRFK